jgi:tetratricopeptide (TPR) repeat protein
MSIIRIEINNADNIPKDEDKVRTLLELEKRIVSVRTRLFSISDNLSNSKKVVRLKAYFHFVLGSLNSSLGQFNPDDSMKASYFKLSVDASIESANAYHQLGDKFTRSLATCLNNAADSLEHLGSVAQDQPVQQEATNINSKKSEQKMVVAASSQTRIEIYQAAIKHLEEALKLKKEFLKTEDYSLFYFNRGSLQLKMAILAQPREQTHTLFEAANSLLEATRYDQKYIAAWHYRVLVFILLQKYAVALDLLKTARSQTNDNPCIMVDFAVLLLVKAQLLMDITKKDKRDETAPTTTLSINRCIEKASGALRIADGEIDKELSRSKHERDSPRESYEFLLFVQKTKTQFFLSNNPNEKLDQTKIHSKSILRPFLAAEMRGIEQLRMVLNR